MRLQILNGRVQLPVQIQGGFLRPVLDWLDSEQEAEAVNPPDSPDHKLFDNVDTHPQ